MKKYTLKIIDLAQIFDVSESTIRKSWIKNGVPFRNIGNGNIPRYRFNEEEVDKWLDNRNKK